MHGADVVARAFWAIVLSTLSLLMLLALAVYGIVRLVQPKKRG